MELVIIICSKEVKRIFRVSSGATALHAIRIQAQDYDIRDTLELSILEADGGWYMTEPPDRIYQIYDNGLPVTLYHPLQDQTVYQIKTVHGEYLCMLSFTDYSIRREFRNYSLAGQTSISLGKQNSNTIRYDIAGLVSGVHLSINYVNQTWILRDQSSNGVYVNLARVKDSYPLNFGDVIDVFGLRLVWLDVFLAVISYGQMPEVRLETEQTMSARMTEEIQGAADAPVEDAAAGRLFHRAPRVILPIRRDAIELDAPPAIQMPHKQPMLLAIGPALTMALPMLLGFGVTAYFAGKGGQSRQTGTYMYTGLITAMASALLGSIWACLNVRSNSRRYEEAEQRRQSAYRRYLERQEKKIADQYEGNANALRSTYPSAREACRYDVHTHVLWNRNATHIDFLVHRMGLGNLPFQAEIQMPKEQLELYEDELRERPRALIRKYRLLHNVPVCVDFDRNRLVGVIEEDGGSEILYTLVTQLAVCHAYPDVKLVFFLDGKKNGRNEDRSFLRWLPHVWSEDKKVRFIDFGEEHPEELLYELSHIFRLRTENAAEIIQGERMLPHYIVLIENYKRMEDELPIHYLFMQPEQCGITTVLFVNQYEELPNNCTFMIQKSEYFTGIYDIEEGEARRRKITLDTVLQKDAAALCRRLAGIETAEPKISSKLPETLTLFALFGIREAEELDIDRNWLESRPDLYLKAPIGMKASGSICCLDVHEKAHGPHGLIAGMTGSGKSEVLQTYIISMAVRYRPEEVGFFLIDYKGGGMANLFLELPHLIGHISNLSGQMIQRAMVSIKSENKRRQTIFNQNGVNNIHEYIRRYRAGETETPLPHIMIIIDEFAELKKEEPDFMKELISVAQVGRSLGVHLILATQKPSGTVDDNIRSNARFRLCLRVQDRQDSTDMLHKADAAYITQAGRAYFQVGNDELYELLQSAWSSAPYEKNQNRYRDAAALLTISGREEYCGHGQGEQDTQGVLNEGIVQTQLEAMIESIQKTAKRLHCKNVSQLWLPMLPQMLSLKELPAAEKDQGEIAVPIGLYDDPRQQRQDTLYVGLTEGGHHVICGMVMSGKSTFLQTLLYALVTEYTPEQLHLYVIDCSSHFLAPFQHAPHTGGFMDENDTDDIRKTIYMLHRFLQERKQQLQGGNFRQYNRSVSTLPAILLVIDNYAVLKEKTDGAFENDLMEFSRTGESYGIYLVVTSGGFGAGDMTVRMAENFRTTMCLRMTDKYQYAGILRLPRVETCPENGVYGRGLAWADGEVLEFQTALALPEPEDYARMEQIEQVCCRLMEQWGSRMTAQKIPRIPDPLTSEEMLSRTILNQEKLYEDLLPVGYFIKTADVCALHFEKWFCLTVTGSRNTGKTNLLKLLITEEALRGTAVYIIDSTEGKLQEMRERSAFHIAGYYTKPEEIFQFYEQLGMELKERYHSRTMMKKKENQRWLIIIGNLAEWTNQHYVNQLMTGTEAFIYNLLTKGSLHNIYFATAFRQENYADTAGRRIFEAFVKYRTGIHMGGSTGDDRILDFSYVPYSEQGKGLIQGHGMLPIMDEGVCGETGEIVIPAVP